jgi:hypothetical protein
LPASQHLPQFLLETFDPVGGSVEMVIDETLERRWGGTIRKRGHYRDSALSLSRHTRSLSSPGLRWIVLALVVFSPWWCACLGASSGGPYPFFSGCARHPPDVSAQLGIRHKTLGARARQSVSLLRRWLPGTPITLLGDGA